MALKILEMLQVWVGAWLASPLPLRRYPMNGPLPRKRNRSLPKLDRQPVPSTCRRNDMLPTSLRATPTGQLDRTTKIPVEGFILAKGLGVAGFCPVLCPNEKHRTFWYLAPTLPVNHQAPWCLLVVMARQSDRHMTQNSVTVQALNRRKAHLQPLLRLEMNSAENETNCKQKPTGQIHIHCP